MISREDLEDLNFKKEGSAYFKDDYVVYLNKGEVICPSHNFTTSDFTKLYDNIKPMDPGLYEFIRDEYVYSITLPDHSNHQEK